MKNILLTLLLISFTAIAQDMGVNWANALGGSGAGEFVRNSVVDASGNLYVVGGYTGTINVNPGGTSATNLTSAGGTDGFIAKYTSSGSLVWASSLGSTGADGVYGIALDGSGNVYVTGYFSNTVDFDFSQQGTSSFTSAGGTDIFWAKYSSAGGFQAVAIPDNGVTNDIGYEITVDGSGNVYLTGYFTGTVDFDPSTSVSNKTSVGGKDIFLGKYSSSNALIWIDTFGSTLDDEGLSLQLIGSEGVLFGGYYSGDMDVNPLSGVTLITNFGSADGIFEIVSQADGDWESASYVRSSGTDVVKKVTVLGSHIYIGGEFSGTPTFGGGTAGTTTRTSNGGTDVFVGKYNLTTISALPDRVWLNTFGGEGNELLYGLTVDAFEEAVAGNPQGNVYATGSFNKTVNFNSSGTAANLTAPVANAYLISYGAEGAYRFVKQVGAATGEGTCGFSITADTGYTGNMYWAGFFSNKVSFASNSSYDRTSAGGFDAFVAKYTPLATEPTASPTGLTFSNITATTYSYIFTAASPAPTGYIHIRKAGSAPTELPVDGTVYTPVEAIGTSSVMYVGTGVGTFNQSAATANTTYYYAIYSYNGSGSSINYRQLSPFTSSMSTLPANTNPTIASFTPATGAVGTSVTISGTNFSTTPANNIVKFNNISATVTASTATSISVTVPSGATTGKITVAIGEQLATSTTDFTIIVPAAEPSGPSNLKFSNVKSTSYSFSFTEPSTAPDGYIHVLREGNEPPDAPDDGVVYTPVQSFKNSKVMYAGKGASFNQSNVSKSTTYQLAIYAYNGSGASVNYNTVNFATSTVTTPAVDPTIQISNESFPTVYTKGNSMTVSISVNDPSLVVKVVLKSKGITQPDTEEKSTEVSGAGMLYEKVIVATDLTDPIGIIYYFEVTDVNQAKITSNIGEAWVRTTDESIPDLSFGSQANNYQIIAIPTVLTNKNVTSTFASLMPYDKTKWRLFDYANGDNREYSSFNTIDPGKGYWLIVKSNTVIKPGEGKAVTADEDSPFEIALSAGWNLIGNPYNFRLSWTDVLAYNSNPSGVGTLLKVFSGGKLADGTILEKYRGAFVFAASATTVKIPVTRNTNLGGRKNSDNEITHSLDQDYWQVALHLKQGNLANELSGIGMHPNATLKGKDQFDEVSVPLPQGLGFFELGSAHPELLTDFNRDIVPSQKEFTWEFSVKNESADAIELTWRNDFFGSNEKKLFLINLTTLETVDMRLQNHFLITAETQKIRIVFGEDEYIKKEAESYLPLIGVPYPIPARTVLNIPFRISEGQKKQVLINVLDTQGRQVAMLENTEYNSGVYETKWYPGDLHGLFLIKIQLGNGKSESVKVFIE